MCLFCPTRWSILNFSFPSHNCRRRRVQRHVHEHDGGKNVVPISEDRQKGKREKTPTTTCAGNDLQHVGSTPPLWERMICCDHFRYLSLEPCHLVLEV